jgi:hypothetical protein
MSHVVGYDLEVMLVTETAMVIRGSGRIVVGIELELRRSVALMLLETTVSIIPDVLQKTLEIEFIVLGPSGESVDPLLPYVGLPKVCVAALG